MEGAREGSAPLVKIESILGGGWGAQPPSTEHKVDWTNSKVSYSKLAM